MYKLSKHRNLGRKNGGTLNINISLASQSFPAVEQFVGFL